MKKYFRALSIVFTVMMLFAFFACGKTEKAETTAKTKSTSTSAAVAKTNVKVAALKGPTGIGMTKLIKDNEDKKAKNNYTFTLASAPDEIVSMIASGQVDIAAVPLNLASTLYNKTSGNVEVVALNTLGNLYILENGKTINSVADLKGKTIYASGKGATPEYVLDYILQKNGINPEKDVTIEYKSEHSELATLAVANRVSLCFLPEPFVTTVLNQNSNFKIALDLNKEWSKTESTSLVTGCIIARKDFVKNNKAALDTFMTEYETSVNFVKKNNDKAAQYVANQGILGSAAVAKKAIPNCNITFVKGDDMKKLAKANLTVLYNANHASIGGTLPKNDFYYGTK